MLVHSFPLECIYLQLLLLFEQMFIQEISKSDECAGCNAIFKRNQRTFATTI